MSLTGSGLEPIPVSDAHSSVASFFIVVSVAVGCWMFCDFVGAATMDVGGGGGV
jgi:hypothetical protein